MPERRSLVDLYNAKAEESEAFAATWERWLQAGIYEEMAEDFHTFGNKEVELFSELYCGLRPGAHHIILRVDWFSWGRASCPRL